MSYSIYSVSGTGAQTAYSVPFPFLAEAHVIVSVGGGVAAYTFTSPSQITFSLPPASGALVVIRRRTPVDELLAIVQGRSVLKTAELNLVYTQLLYIMQEAFDVTDLLENSTIEVAAALALVQETLENILAIARGIAYQYDCIISIPYNPAAGDSICSFPIVRSVSLVALAPGSLANTLTPSDGLDVVFSIQKNAVEVGTLTFPTGDNAGVFSVPVTADFISGDILTVRCTDGNVAIRDIGITLKLQRNGGIT